MSKLLIMKTIIVIGAVAAIVFSCSCRKVINEVKQPIPVTAVTVLTDKTDTMLAEPDATSIRQLFPLNQDHSQGAAFRAGEISDVQYNQVENISIAAQNALLSNPGERTAEVAHFLAGVSTVINKLDDLPAGKSHSSIYAAVASEANLLAAQNATKKVLLVYSDLEENATFSMYRPGDYLHLVNHPAEIEAMFQKQVPLGNLTGIEVHLIYQARNYEDGQRYQVISSAYKDMFQQAGAVVTIQANLQNL
jgi:hypothetical protein